jgi:hypothetical protein
MSRQLTSAAHGVFSAGLALALLLAAIGCSVRHACTGEKDEFVDVAAGGDDLSGSQVLSTTNESMSLDFIAGLSGLPELWESSTAIERSFISIHLNLQYLEEPLGGDGQTEMPRVMVTFTPEDWYQYYPDSNQTPRFPGADGAYFGSRIFRTCISGKSGASGCCVYGASECEAPISVRISRMDGAPFPPVSVAWSAQASASINTCPLGDAAPRLSLELVKQ